jgi:hypothetical protein
MKTERAVLPYHTNRVWPSPGSGICSDCRCGSGHSDQQGTRVNAHVQRLYFSDRIAIELRMLG